MTYKAPDIKYTIRELIILYNLLRPENGHYAQMIKRDIVMSIHGNDPDKLLKYLYYQDLIEPFQMPLENIPLHINDDQAYIRIVALWRLKIGR
jgi:hypothetical protein